MGEIRNFHGARPGERDDGEPYVQVRFEEAPDVAGAPGTWTTIDLQDLTPIDDDPAAPIVRNLTTAEATLDIGWYRLVFVDAEGDEDRSTPVAWPPTAIDQPDLDLLAPLSLAELNSYADAMLAGNQEQLRRSLAAAVLFCQTYTRRSLVAEGDTTPVTKPVVSDGESLRVRVPDVREITSVRLDGTLVDPSACVLQFDRWGWPAPRMIIPTTASTIVIAGKFGFLEYPADIRDALYTDAIRRAKDKDAGFADRVDLGDGTVLSYFRTMPARVQSTYNSMRIASDFMGAT